MRVLVTGALGMLGTDLCARLRAEGVEVTPTDVRGDAIPMDVCDVESVRGVMEGYQPDVVIHCAAYTNVDGAEADSAGAYRLNGLGSWAVATACAERDVPLCAISTDFVFDGLKAAPYTEYDAPNPLGVYGASKLAGEVCVRDCCRKHWIVRTSWLYGMHGKCFPDTILKAAVARPELRVIADQHGTPTYTVDLAEALVHVIRSPLYGTYHVANLGVTSWYDFARKALELAGISTPVFPILASDWPSPTRRPAYSALRPLALEMQGAPLPRPWEEALANYVARRAAHAAAPLTAHSSQ
jgi:dTDP-4-dehydrorhamnose reductase